MRTIAFEGVTNGPIQKLLSLGVGGILQAGNSLAAVVVAHNAPKDNLGSRCWRYRTIHGLLDEGVGINGPIGDTGINNHRCFLSRAHKPHKRCRAQGTGHGRQPCAQFLCHVKYIGKGPPSRRRPQARRGQVGKGLRVVDERDKMTAMIPGIGQSGIDALRRSKVLVAGAGGLGSPVLFYLAAAGVGTLGISDPDIVDESNLQRQIIHATARIGCNKADSAAQAIAALNPAVATIKEPAITADNAADIVSGYDIVVDATDNFDAKYVLSDSCREAGIAQVWGTLVGMDYLVSLFDDGLSLRDLYPTAPPRGSTPTSADIGVLGAVCGQAGSVMATEVIKHITGVGTRLLGRVLIGDGRDARWNVVDFRTPPLPGRSAPS